MILVLFVSTLYVATNITEALEKGSEKVKINHLRSSRRGINFLIDQILRPSYRPLISLSAMED
ncbi:hypothetical protein SAMN04488028_106131 [Reichenbachiella agariperforans]|uniref:Uncharacterized protein n=1 Tax=Reichenbachiella agariperforans TaxID=156994 RepID=A0A1M6TQA7_REIAG|nr:hypothetical protein SAMN04488028_106131 [Reichenbachiella agariperforans]